MRSSRELRFALRFETVRDGDCREHLDLLEQANGEYIELETALQQITWEEFEDLFTRVGEVRTIYFEGEKAGFFWIEARGRILHLHALVLKFSYQMRGIGREVLKKLAETYQPEQEAMQLGIHVSNYGSLEFFLKQGFERVNEDDGSGFVILQKRLGGME